LDRPPQFPTPRLNLRRAVGKLGEAFWFPAGRRNFGQAVENLAVRRPLHDFLTNHAQPREQQNESNEGT